MATKIVTKNSSTASAVPTASDLVQGELAVNVADKRLFTEDNAGAIVELGTNPTTLTVTGEITANGGIALGDGDVATFGDSDDLSIFHAGGTTYLTNTTGSLVLRTDSFRVLNTANSEQILHGDANGAVTAYYDNSVKLATTFTGIDVTGTATMDGLTVNAGTNKVVLANNFATTGNTDSPKLAFYSFGDVATYPVSGPSIKKVNTGSYGAGDLVIYQHGPTDFTNEVEALRIDSSGNLLLGGTNTNPTGANVAGIALDASGEINASVAGGDAVRFNRKSDHGDIVRIMKDGITHGVLGTSSGTNRIFDINASTDGASEMRFLTHSGSANVEAMRIDSSGRVGIGTSSPAKTLEVNAGTNTEMRIGTTTNGSLQLGHFSNGAFIGTDSGTPAAADLVRFGTGGSERLRIDSSGNLIKAGGVIKGERGTAAAPPYTFSDDTDTGMFNISNADLGFSVGGTERMRIDSSGNLLVGTSSVSAGLSSGKFVVGFAGNIANGIKVYDSYASAATNNAVVFIRGSSEVGSITTTTSATAYNTSSDQRLKENIADADDAGSKIDAIQVRKYDWKADGSHQDYGMIAQELQAVAPEAVSGDADSEEMMGVDYSKLVPMMLKEIQSLRNRVAQLEE